MQNIFEILGIEQTKDESLIKAAYRKLLPQVNPEEDQEGFIRLRKAYEAAIAYAKNDGQSELEQINPAVAEFIKEVHRIYSSLKLRLSTEAWDKLLENSVLIDLNTEQQAFEEFFIYLCEHFRMPAKVYQVINDYFNVIERPEELTTFLPEGFVNYMVRLISDVRGVNDYPYQWLEGEDDADYDTFIDAVYQLEGLTVEGKWKEALECEAYIKGLNISHPYFDVQRASIMLNSNNGQSDEAFSLLKNICEKYPTIYLAHVYLSWCYEAKGLLANALEHREISQQLNYTVSNEKYIKELYTKLLEQSERSGCKDKNIIQWCVVGCIRLNCFEKAKKYYEYCKNEEWIIGASYKAYVDTAFAMDEGDLDEALNLVHNFLDMTDEENIVKSENSVNIQNPVERVNAGYIYVRQQLLDILINNKQYKQAYKLAWDIIHTNSTFLPAVLHLQRAAYRVNSKELVLNLYNMGLDMMPDNPQWYEYAARVLIDFGQPENAKMVIDKAKERGLESAGLTFVYIQYRRTHDEDYKVIDEIRNIVLKCEKEYDKGNIEPELMSELYYELSKCCSAAGHPYAKQLEDRIYMKKCLDVYPSVDNNYYYGNLLLREQQYDQALEYLREAEKGCESDDIWLQTHLAQNIGFIFHKKGDYHEALNYYYRGIEINPNDQYLQKAISRVCTYFMELYGSSYYAYEALKYLNMVLNYSDDYEKVPFLINKCKVTLALGKYEQTLECAEQILDIRVLDTEAFYYQGSAYMGLGKFDKALSSLKDAADNMEGADMFLDVYQRAGNVCEFMGDFEQAESWYKKGRDWNTREEKFFRMLYNMYIKTAQHDKAENMRSHIWYQTASHYSMAVKKTELARCTDEAKRQVILEELKKIADGTDSRIKHCLRMFNDMYAWAELADVYLYYLQDYKNAQEIYHKALKFEKDSWDTRSIILSLMYLYYLKRDFGMVHKYGEQFMQIIEEHYAFNNNEPAINQFTEALTDRRRNYKHLAVYWLCIGDLDKAREYKKCMEEYVDYFEKADTVYDYDSTDNIDLSAII